MNTPTAPTIQFTNGAAYERYMGLWSQQVGQAFIDWLGAPSGGRWLDVGCGNGAFTELVAQRCQPQALAGIDPSAQQLDFARARASTAQAEYVQGDAMALPYGPAQFDVAVMPLVIFFLTDPALGVAEMARVVRPGGLVAAYSWDMAGGGFPYALLQDELNALGVAVPTPPSPQASDMDVLANLWAGAGLRDIATRDITVQRTYASFDDYWATVQGAPSMGAKLAALSAEHTATLKARLQARLGANAAGEITCSARANAIVGTV